MRRGRGGRKGRGRRAGAPKPPAPSAAPAVEPKPTPPEPKKAEPVKPKEAVVKPIPPKEQKRPIPGRKPLTPPDRTEPKPAQSPVEVSETISVSERIPPHTDPEHYNAVRRELANVCRDTHTSGVAIPLQAGQSLQLTDEVVLQINTSDSNGLEAVLLKGLGGGMSGLVDPEVTEHPILILDPSRPDVMTFSNAGLIPVVVFLRPEMDGDKEMLRVVLVDDVSGLPAQIREKSKTPELRPTESKPSEPTGREPKPSTAQAKPKQPDPKPPRTEPEEQEVEIADKWKDSSAASSRTPSGEHHEYDYRKDETSLIASLGSSRPSHPKQNINQRVKLTDAPKRIHIIGPYHLIPTRNENETEVAFDVVRMDGTTGNVEPVLHPNGSRVTICGYPGYVDVIEFSCEQGNVTLAATALRDEAGSAYLGINGFVVSAWGTSRAASGLDSGGRSHMADHDEEVERFDPDGKEPVHEPGHRLPVTIGQQTYYLETTGPVGDTEDPGFSIKDEHGNELSGTFTPHLGSPDTQVCDIDGTNYDITVAVFYDRSDRSLRMGVTIKNQLQTTVEHLRTGSSGPSATCSTEQTGYPRRGEAVMLGHSIKTHAANGNKFHVEQSPSNTSAFYPRKNQPTVNEFTHNGRTYRIIYAVNQDDSNKVDIFLQMKNGPRPGDWELVKSDETAPKRELDDGYTTEIMKAVQVMTASGQPVTSAVHPEVETIVSEKKPTVTVVKHPHEGTDHVFALIINGNYVTTTGTVGTKKRESVMPLNLSTSASQVQSQVAYRFESKGESYVFVLTRGSEGVNAHLIKENETGFEVQEVKSSVLEKTRRKMGEGAQVNYISEESQTVSLNGADSMFVWLERMDRRSTDAYNGYVGPLTAHGHQVRSADLFLTQSNPTSEHTIHHIDGQKYEVTGVIFESDARHQVAVFVKQTKTWGNVVISDGSEQELGHGLSAKYRNNTPDDRIVQVVDDTGHVFAETEFDSGAEMVFHKGGHAYRVVMNADTSEDQAVFALFKEDQETWKPINPHGFPENLVIPERVFNRHYFQEVDARIGTEAQGFALNSDRATAVGLPIVIHPEGDGFTINLNGAPISTKGHAQVFTPKEGTVIGHPLGRLRLTTSDSIESGALILRRNGDDVDAFIFDEMAGRAVDLGKGPLLETTRRELGQKGNQVSDVNITRVPGTELGLDKISGDSAYNVGLVVRNGDDVNRVYTTNVQVPDGQNHRISVPITNDGSTKQEVHHDGQKYEVTLLRIPRESSGSFDLFVFSKSLGPVTPKDKVVHSIEVDTSASGSHDVGDDISLVSLGDGSVIVNHAALGNLGVSLESGAVEVETADGRSFVLEVNNK